MEPARFTQGSTLRHVLVMTGAGSIGLMAIFIVDFLSLFYVARLQNPNLTAAVGFASQALFFFISVNIGLSIAIGALVGKALGAGQRPDARRLAASGLVHVFLLTLALTVAVLPFRGDILYLFGARDEALEVGTRFSPGPFPRLRFLVLAWLSPGFCARWEMHAARCMSLYPGRSRQRCSIRSSSLASASVFKARRS